jgi:putative flippase GtrA
MLAARRSAFLNKRIFSLKHESRSGERLTVRTTLKRGSKMRNLYKRYKEMILYIVFGVLTTAVNYGVYFLFAHPVGFSVAVSNIIAWLAGVLFAFVTNKLLVFESKSLSARVFLWEFLSFVACRLFSGLLDTGIMVVCVDYLHYNDMIIKILSNVIVVIINYVFSKFFIFTKKEKQARAN